MKIFYDHTAFQQPYGGISRYFYELIIRLLRSSELDISLFMGLFLNRYGLARYKERYRHYWGYPIPSVAYCGLLRRFVNENAWRIFQMKTSPAEGEGSIYHPTYYNFSGLPKATTVFTVYDFAHERFPSLFAGDKTPVLKRKAFERADALICISESTKKDLLELYRVDSECRIRVIHLGYSDLTVLPEIPIQLPEKPYFLFVGPRHTYKNFECIVKAFALRPELKKDFCLVCFGGAPFSSKESNLLAGFGLADHVIRFSGGDEILGALYKHAAALVYPSLYEGFGMPIPEAMNCGCPVIAGNTGSIPEVAGDAALLFDPRSPEALAEALIAVAHDEQLKMKLILEGRRRCRCFSWDRCAGETLSLYRALLNH